MSAPTELSCAVSGIMSVVVFAAMQVLQDTFKSSELGTIAGGLIGSILFLLLLTFINNFENLVLDKGFASSLIPEVLIALGKLTVLLRSKSKTSHLSLYGGESQTFGVHFYSFPHFLEKCSVFRQKSFKL